MQTYDQYLSTNPDDALDAEPCPSCQEAECECPSCRNCGTAGATPGRRCWYCNAWVDHQVWIDICESVLGPQEKRS